MWFIATTHQRSPGTKDEERGRVWVQMRSGAGYQGQMGRGESSAHEGQETRETNRVTGTEQCSKLGPMGIRERENVLGKGHIGETVGSGPTGQWGKQNKNTLT